MPLIIEGGRAPAAWAQGKTSPAAPFDHSRPIQTVRQHRADQQYAGRGARRHRASVLRASGQRRLATFQYAQVLLADREFLEPSAESSICNSLLLRH